MAHPASLLRKYRVDGTIGSGGMGTICRAHHLELDRPAAVKFLTEGSFDAHDPLLRFAEEAKICSQLHHPNVVQVFDVDVESRPPYIVFELVEGTTLQAWMDDRRAVGLGALLELLALVFDGLHHAHQRGVVHRDLKPANLLLDKDSVPKVADFGLAKFASGGSSVKTKTGIVLGTPTYMAPEHARDREVGPAADLYSMGVIAFELLAGRLPFEAKADAEVLLAHIRTAPPRVREFDPSLPPALDDLIDELLRKDPATRPPDAAAVAARLRRIRLGLRGEARDAEVRLGVRRERVGGAGLTGLAPAVGPAPRAVVVRRSRPALLALALVAAVAAVGSHLAFRRRTGAPERQVSGFSVAFRGARAALVTWRASVREARPLVRVTESGREVPVRLARLEVEEEGAVAPAPGTRGWAGASFRYVALVTGLQPSSRYRVSLADGSAADQGLSHELQTSAETRFAPRRSLELTPDGKVVLTLQDRQAFWAEVAPPPEDAVPPVGGRARLPSSSLRLTWRLADLDEEQELGVTLTPLEGAPARVAGTVVDLVEEELGRVAAAFTKERQTGRFYERWKALGRVNELFHRAGQELTAVKPGDGAGRQRVLGAFWQSVTASLQADADWYALLAPQLPGLRALAIHKVCRERLGAALALARLPLWLLQGTALLFHLWPNPAWEGALMDGGPFGGAPRERPWLRSPEHEFDFVLERHKGEGTDLHIVDSLCPVKEGGLFGQGALQGVGATPGACVDVRQASVDLGTLDPARFTQAEVELVSRGRAPWMVPLISFGDGKFVAAFPETAGEVARYASAWEDLRALWLRGGGRWDQWGVQATPVATGAATAAQQWPEVRRWHRVPLSVLHRGVNRVEVSAIAGPVDSWPTWSFSALRLRLGNN